MIPFFRTCFSSTCLGHVRDTGLVLYYLALVPFLAGLVTLIRAVEQTTVQTCTIAPNLLCYAVTITRIPHAVPIVMCEKTIPDARLQRPRWTVSADIQNVGNVTGCEVPQLYLAYPESAGEPPRVLRDFTR